MLWLHLVIIRLPIKFDFSKVTVDIIAYTYMLKQMSQITVPHELKNKVRQYIINLQKPTKVSNDIINSSNAIMLVMDLAKYTKVNPYTNEKEFNYNDILYGDNLLYTGQWKKIQFDYVLQGLYDDSIRKPVFVVFKVGNTIYNVYKVTEYHNFTPREEQLPPVLVLGVQNLDVNSFAQFRATKNGTCSFPSFLKKLKITKLLNIRSGIHPVNVGNTSFLEAL